MICLCALWCVTVSVCLSLFAPTHVTGNPRIVSNSRIGNPRCFVLFLNLLWCEVKLKLFYDAKTKFKSML